MSKLTKSNLPCPDCGSSDALAIYGEWSHCFSCGTHKRTTEQEQEELEYLEDLAEEVFPIKSPVIRDQNIVVKEHSRDRQVHSIPEQTNLDSFRGLSKSTLEKFKVWREGDHIFYPHYSRSNLEVHQSNKRRTISSKAFLWEGEPKGVALFGQNLFPPGSANAITLTEGQDDAMAAFQMQGSKYPCVSVHSASTARKDVADNFEYLNAFKEIVLVFDRDNAHIRPDGTKYYPGQEAALEVASMFPLGKVRICTLSRHKDANDYLLNGQVKEFVDEWWKAPIYTPAGLKLGKDMWEEIKAVKNYETCSYPWTGLNDYTYGIRLSELVVLTADSGVGKTSIIKEIEYHLLRNTERGIGLLHLEEPNSDTLTGLMSIDANKPLHIPDVRAEVKENELREYFDRTVNTDRIVIWDHFGSNSIDEVLSKIRHMHNLGCKYIILDHLSIIVSDQSGDERKQLDEITTKLKTLCMELNIAVIAVIHQNRSGQIRGTAGVEQLSNMVIKLYRDKTSDDEWRRNVTKMVIEKNRFCGLSGPACYLFYDQATGRLVELTKDEINRYETKGLSPMPTVDGVKEQWEDLSNV